MQSLTLKKISKTLRQEGVRSLAAKALKRARYRAQRLAQPGTQFKPLWAELRGAFSGQRAFLVGNGPSLNKTPLHLLKDEYTICFNRFYIMLERLNWTPSFYMTVDNLVLNDMVTEVDDILSFADYVFLPDLHFRGENYFRQIGDRDRILWMQQVYGRGFSTDLPKVYPGGSVIYEAFQVLRFLGFETIYMIGVDMNFRRHETARQLAGKRTDIISQDDDDPNHFDPRYFGKDRSYHQPESHVVDYILESLAYLSEVQGDYGLEVVNAGYDSQVDYFRREDFREVLSYSEAEEAALFEESLALNTRHSAVEEFLSDAEILPPQTEKWPAGIGDAVTDTATGLRLLKEAVFSHVPLGPFQGQYYFAKR